MQENNALVQGIEQRNVQIRPEQCQRHPRKSGTAADVQHTCPLGEIPGAFDREQQAVEEMLLQNAVTVRDRGQIDLFVVFYQKCGIICELLICFT